MKKAVRQIVVKGAAVAASAGLILSAAAPAHAGRSVPATYNGGTGIYFKYSASTDNFCIKASTKARTAEVEFYRSGVSYPYAGIVLGPENGWGCVDLTDTFRQDERVRFKLINKTTGRISNGYITI